MITPVWLRTGWQGMTGDDPVAHKGTEPSPACLVVPSTNTQPIFNQYEFPVLGI